jgi:hypothetical protein
VTATAQPWSLTREIVRDAGRQGLDEGQIEAAVGVVSMFNYFTRVADATGIEFDYQTPLPAFEPDRGQVVAPRPDRPVSPGRHAERLSGGDAGQSSGRDAEGRMRPRHEQLRSAWESWRSYVLESDEPIGTRERRLLASVAAEESADWEAAEALGGAEGSDGDRLAGFARKLSREPWRMQEGDLNGLRALGYSEEAVLHVISVVAHQNADSRLALGLRAAAGS